MSDRVDVLVLTGSMGAGKTTVMGEVSDLLTARGIAHAAIDLDVLGMGYQQDVAFDVLTMQNLKAVWTNYARVGLRRLLIAAALEDTAERDGVREAIPGAVVVVCRLCARLETMMSRVRVREPGLLSDRFVARVVELEARLDSALVEDFRVDNDDRVVTDVAHEVSRLAKWPIG